MSNPPFPILGAVDAPLVGREAIMQRLWSDLTKDTPSNLSVVGPRYIGKSVCLKALRDRAGGNESPYKLVVYWELGHAPPQSDEAFISALCEQLRTAMGATQAEYKDHREYLLEGTYTDLKEVMKLLEDEGRSVLMIWDGLDKPLGQGRLTGHLFGQLRDLFHGKRHKIVTAARAAQSELARNKQVFDSEFWNLFDVNPVRLGPFQQSDIAAALTVAGMTLSQGAAKELDNWTGGFPLLVLSVLNCLAEKEIRAEVSPDAMNKAATDSLEGVAEPLVKVWENDCTVGAQDTFRLLIECDKLPVSEVGRDDAQCLISRGFAAQDGNKIRPSCRMLQHHVRSRIQSTAGIARQFSNWEGFRSGIRGILELRLQQIPVVNNRLHRLVRRSLEDIPESPDDCLNNVNSIEEQALDVIWEHEFGADTVPQSIVSYWTQPPRDGDNIIDPMMRADDWRIPRDRFKQVALLQRLTGSKANFDARAKSVSKDTYVLINAIHSFRNRNQHADGQAMHVGVAVAAVITCVELLGCLARECAKATNI